MANLLVSVADLDQLPETARLIDVRYKLGDPLAGHAMFDRGRIPGAVFVDMDEDLAAPPGIHGRHPLPSAKQFAAAMSRAGVDRHTWVIVYDEGGTSAARLWWLLHHFGHETVSILDGGYAAWLASGRPVETGPAVLPQPGQFVAVGRQDDFYDIDSLRQALDQGSIHLLDARGPERWRGEVEPVDRFPGRIPGAINAPASDNVRAEIYRPAAELRTHYAALGILDGKPIVVACGSGVSACVDLVGLELAGIHGARLYPGSYSEWIAQGQPVDRGPA